MSQPYTLLIHERGFPAVSFAVVVARTHEARQRGLAGQHPLYPMLLAWPEPTREFITSAGMREAFDVAFLNRDGVVIGFKTHFRPNTGVFRPSEPYFFALELPFGTLTSLGADRVGAKVYGVAGDVQSLPHFGPWIPAAFRHRPH